MSNEGTVSGTPGDRRLFTSTRRQTVTLLRRSARTVEELATTLDLTYNGVRVHLTVLERERIVPQRGPARQSSGKPAYLYELTPAVENLFPKAYESVLHQLLEVLNKQVGYEQSDALLQRVGRSMANQRIAAANGARLEEAVATPNELGGFAELEVQQRLHHSQLQLPPVHPSARSSRGVAHGKDAAQRVDGYTDA
jgi:predicted ArsR family transcriptional regulator